MSREFLDLCTGHSQSWVFLELGDVVVIEVVLQQGAAAVDIEPDTLEHWTFLEFGETQILKWHSEIMCSAHAMLPNLLHVHYMHIICSYTKTSVACVHNIIPNRKTCVHTYVLRTNACIGLGIDGPNQPTNQICVTLLP